MIEADEDWFYVQRDLQRDVHTDPVRAGLSNTVHDTA